jgi:hypothetical protein
MRTSALFFLLWLASISAGSAAEQSPASSRDAHTGELQIYSHSTSIGTIACRTFRDETGRVAKEIYYTSTRGLRSHPPTEAELKVQSVYRYTYNQDGLRVKRDIRDPDNTIRTIIHSEYNSARKLVREWSEDGDGVRRWERHLHDDGQQSELKYDDLGKRVVTIRGQVRKDIDLPDGWGGSTNGFACGIVLSKTNGALNEIELWVNIKNIGESTVFIQSLPGTVMMLRDAQGKEISESSEYVQARKKSLVNQPNLYGQLLPPGAGGYLYPAYALKERFPNLPPGQYTLRLRQPVLEAGASLESNPVTFLIQ